MDSKAINKLIRSEIWPILRDQGFSVFDSRSAFAYKAPFINMVSFQSFNSYNAEVLGCTTFSFTPRLGVYVIGSPGEHRVKRDKAGHLQPFESACSFRSELRKRTAVDGFARDDIFYIDPEGRTTAHCFNELKYLCNEVASLWFKSNNDLDDMLSRMRRAEESNSASFPDACGCPGSYNWNQLESVLLLLKHRNSQTQNSAEVALASINRTIGTILDFSTIQSGRPGEESYAAEMGELWSQLGAFRPMPVCAENSVTDRGCLNGPIWVPSEAHLADSVSSPSLPSVLSTRKQFWPLLKNAGFSEFTDRLAHRVSKDVVEVVEYLPMDPYECKTWKLPSGLFRVGVGVFWPSLREDGLVRMNRMGDPRPIVNECHISNWLSPETRTCKTARTAFEAIEDATAALVGPGLRWLDIFRNYESALSQLQRKDWELFWYYPMMRGYGASSSGRRLVYIALLKLLLGSTKESKEHIRLAEAAVHTWYPEHLRLRYGAWVDQVKHRLLAAPTEAQSSITLE
jgi:hypothetical protein